jgi:hypothetical protein
VQSQASESTAGTLTQFLSLLASIVGGIGLLWSLLSRPWFGDYSRADRDWTSYWVLVVLAVGGALTLAVVAGLRRRPVATVVGVSLTPLAALVSLIVGVV